MLQDLQSDLYWERYSESPAATSPSCKWGCDADVLHIDADTLHEVASQYWGAEEAANAEFMHEASPDSSYWHQQMTTLNPNYNPFLDNSEFGTLDKVKDDEQEHIDTATHFETAFPPWSGQTNIVDLLDTLSCVLWPGTEWQGVAIDTLKVPSHTKNAYQQAIRLCHPDKLSNTPDQIKPHALAVFERLSAAYNDFECDLRAQKEFGCPESPPPQTVL